MIPTGSAFHHSRGPSLLTVDIVGVAFGRFTMTDFRDRDYDWQAAQTVENFTPGSVPILTRHGGERIGDVETLTADGSDLRFTGWVMGDPDLIARLRRGVSISPAFVEVTTPRYDGTPQPGSLSRPLAVTHPHFDGVLGPGRSIVEIAIEERPAARLSWMRAV
jgi:hypothetical protein